MSMSESAIGAPSAAPPVSSAPAAPSSAPTPAAPSAESTPAAVPAVAEPSESTASAVPSSASTPARPQTQEDATARYHERLEAIRKSEAEGDTQPPAAAEPEQSEAEPVAVEEPEAPALPEAAAPEVETEDGDSELLTTEQIEALRIPKSEKAKIAQINAQAAQLREVHKTLGSEIGVKLASEILPILWTDCPFNEATQPAEAQAWWDEQSDSLLDAIVLPEKAGAEQLFNHLSRHFVTTALYDERPAMDDVTGQPVLDAEGKPVPIGAMFANKVIAGEYGNTPDGQPYDLPLISRLVQAHKEGLINMEFVDAELREKAETGAPEPTPKELELQAELDKVKAQTEGDATAAQQRAAEEKRKSDERMEAYKVQAKGFVSRYVMKPLMPQLADLGWAPQPGEAGSQLEQKQFFADVITTYFNLKLEGTSKTPSADYQGVQDMIDNGTAFGPDGKPTQRFTLRMQPLGDKAAALLAKAKRNLGPILKFAASTSRNAQLAKKNGKDASERTTPALAVPEPPVDPNAPVDWEAKQAAARAKLRAASAGRERPGVL